jgi:phosphoribosylanthranilate isomerase
MSVYNPRIKICCIGSMEEAQMAVAYGAAAVGLVSEMPSGPGVISEALIAKIAASIPPSVSSFLLTSNVTPEAIVAQQHRCRTDTIQLCDALDSESLAALREALPGIRLVQVIHVTGPEAGQQARSLAAHVDALLLDSGNPTLTVKELGGTGRVHDWSISREIRESVSVPVFLAGGLNPRNVGAAIQQVRPFGVDICSGVRRDGRLDEAKLASFVAQVVAQRSASAQEA